MGSFLSAVGRVIGTVCMILLFVAVIGPFVASQIYLERSGISANGTIIGKNERVVDNSRSNSWTRQLTLQIRFPQRDDPEEITTSLPVDLATYDAYTIGSAVEVRYAPDKRLRPWGIFGVKLAEQPPFAVLMTMTDDPGLITAGLVILGMLVVWMMFRTRSLVLRVGYGVMLVALIGVGFIMSIRPAAIFEPGPRESVTARVLNVERITKEPGNSRGRRRTADELIRPIDRVRLEFTPQGKASSVVAVDDIDADSIMGIAKGEEHTISYPVANPRSAHLVGATYQHRWQNWLMVPRTLVFFLVAFGIFALIGFFFRRFIRRGTRHRVTT